MGEVFLARDEHLPRNVAVKVLPPSRFRDEASCKRLRKEAISLSALHHANIATIFDFDTQDGIDYIVMEYVEGRTLSDMVPGIGLPEKEVVHLGAQLAEGLDAAHSRGVVHRDLKPTNIRVTPEGQLKILDFGLATFVGSAGDLMSTDSDPGSAVAGTLPYMSPEQLHGVPAETRSDIYSAGVVLYEMATGRRPFGGAFSAQIVTAILKDAPASPSSLNPQVSARLESIILKCLDKNPERRYQSARELLVDLRRVVDPTTTAIRLTAPRAPLHRLAMAALLIVIVLAAVRPTYQPPPPPVQQSRPWVLLADFDNLAGKNGLDITLREGLKTGLRQSREINLFPRERVFEVLQRMKRADAQRIDAQLGREICRRENIQLLLAGSITSVGGDVFQVTVEAIDPVEGNAHFGESQQLNAGAELFGQVDDLARRLRRQLGESAADVAANSRPLARVTTSSIDALTLYSRAAEAFARGNMDEVSPLLQSALRLDPNFAMAHRLLGKRYAWRFGNNEQSRAEFQHAFELRGDLGDRERLWIEADYFTAHEQYEEAARSLQALVALHPDDPDAHYELGLAFYSLSRLDEAIAEMSASLGGNPDSALTYGKLVVYQFRSNRYAEARSTYQTAEARGLVNEYLHWGAGLASLGQRDVTAARRHFEQSGREFRDTYLAVADLDEGKLRSAAAHLQSVIQRFSASRAALNSHRLLGDISLMEGDAGAARRHATAILGQPQSVRQTVDLAHAGILYAQAGDLVRAQQISAQLAAELRHSPTGWNTRCFRELEGEIALSKGNVGHALQSFQLAADAYPDPTLHQRLAIAYERLQQPARAIEEWNQFLTGRGMLLQNGFPPDLAVAHIQLGRLYARANDLSQAKDHYQKAAEWWAQADDFPLRRAASRELASLSGSPGEH